MLRNNIEAKVIKSSVADNCPVITTMLLKYPRFIHAEMMTHRVFSRNCSSSRAIPVSAIINAVVDNPARPEFWGINEPGMQAYTESDTPHICEAYWLDSRDYAVKFAKEFSQRLKLHKQIVNRILEPYSHITMVVTSTEWDNFFHLRDHKAAQPEIKILAKMMHEAYDDASPQFLERGEWHLPFTNSTHRDYITQSVASCARTSYNKHDGTKATAEENSDLVAMLSSRPYTNEAKNIHFDIHEPVHLSPLEHQATPMGNQDTLLNVEGETKLDSNNQLWSGNFRQWIQLRQVIHAIVL